MNQQPTVNLNLKHVEVKVEQATERAMKQLALRITERTQLNIRQNDQIDTGFMVNSVYPIWREGRAEVSKYDEAYGKSYAITERAGKYAYTRLSNRRAVQRGSKRARRRVSVVERRIAEEHLGHGHAAAVVVGANYAIYQEAAKPFLWPAAQASSSEFGGRATQIYQQEIGGE